MYNICVKEQKKCYKKIYIVTYLRCDYRRGMNWILDLLEQPGTTSNYSTIADLHTLRITTAPTKPFQASCVLTSCSWQRLLTVEILQIPALRFSCHSRQCRTLVNSLNPRNSTDLAYNFSARTT
jgi:hypothetical protein